MDNECGEPQEEKSKLGGDCREERAQLSVMRCIHEIFEEQAAKTPERVAVVAGELRISYRELDERANWLAHLLQRRGVQPDSLVGLCVDRSIEMFVALLAILKAGAGYLPLDHELPRQRLLHMQKDAGLTFMVTQRKFVDLFEPSDVQSVLIGEGEAGNDERSSHPPKSSTTGEGIAYCLYTSGSTGTPKGVLIQHSGVVNVLSHFSRATGISLEDVWLAITPLSFDISVVEIFLPLARGARVVVADRTDARDPRRIIDLVREHRVSILQSTPATWRMLRFGSPQAAFHLKVAITGGEAVDVALGAYLCSIADTVWNGYGPSETTIYSTTDLVKSSSAVTLGHPISNTRIFILDQALNEVATGEVGEICIAGAGLARGYLNRPALTEEKFVLSPSLPDAGRIYRSGDLGRVGIEGKIEYLGRMDHQVKVRGFRVELGEIEEVLLLHPDIREAAVIADAIETGDTQLFAYIVAVNESTKPNVDALRAHLMSRVPEHMLPSLFVYMARLPLTSSGKTDRTRLARPSPDIQLASGQPDEPVSQTETEMLKIWQTVLRMPLTGIEDRFWNVGGTSLQAVQIAYAVKAQWPGLDRPPLPLNNTNVRLYADVVDQLLADLSQHRQQGPRPVHARGDAAERTAARLSSALAQMCFLDEFGEAWRAYRTHSAITFAGPLHRREFEGALQDLVNRHSILRSAIDSTGEHPVLKVHPAVPIALDSFDLAGMSTETGAARYREILGQALRQRFDLRSAPLVKWTLVKTAEDRHTLIHSEHHGAGDAQSLRMILRDLAALYSARVRQGPSGLTPLAATYADFCEEELRWMTSPAFDNALAQWDRHLRSFRKCGRIFDARPVKAALRFTGAQVRRRLPASRHRLLGKVAVSVGASRFVVAFAAFAVLCAKQSSLDSFLIGTAIANRTDSKFSDVVGMFVNMVPVPFEIDRTQRFSQLVRTLSQTMEFSMAYGGVPLSEIVSRLVWPDRAAGVAPFDVGFSFNENIPSVQPFEQAEVTVEHMLDNGSAKFDLNVVVNVLGEGEASHAELVFEFNSSVLERAEVEALVDRYVELIGSACEAPDTCIAKLDTLGPDERFKILHDWNDTHVSFRSDALIHQLFEEQVTRTPKANALVMEGVSVTYEELNSRANQLARHLQANDVAPQDFIGLCVDRSFDLVVGMLGILKARAVYVPLDSEHPADRLQYMLCDTAAKVVVTHSRFNSMLERPGLRLLSLDGDRDVIQTQPDGNLSIPYSALDLAYCLYTSGSTGRPKGVLVQHQGVVNFLESFRRTTAIDENDVLMCVTPATFDISGLEIYLPLTCGARVAIVTRADSRDAGRLIALSEASGVTVLQATPATWRLLRFQDQRRAFNLKVALVGGEAVDPQLAAYVCSVARTAWNVYGPTETTIWSTKALLSLEKSSGDVPSVTLGRPIDNTQVYILDQDLEPVPVGVIGEIHIAGVGLARGYLNQPELTQARFIMNPFGQPGSKMYKTGDLGRYTGTGEIEYLGRMDHQVKIQGLRIELGEIESELTRHAGLRDAVVTVFDRRTDNPKLAAHVVARNADNMPSAASLREHLAATLPDAMLPTRFVFLAALPLNSSGKVDRNALHAPTDVALPERAQTSMPPTSNMEKTIAQLWAAVLGVAQVGRLENFFDLGGNSLALARLQRQLRNTLDTAPSLVEMFQLPTVAEQAAHFEASAARRTVAAMPSEAVMPLSDEDIDAILTVAQLIPGEAICVLGAGSVEVAIAAAMRHQVRAFVCEHDDLDSEGRKLALLEGVEELVDFVSIATLREKLSSADCVIYGSGARLTDRESVDGPQLAGQGARAICWSPAGDDARGARLPIPNGGLSIQVHRFPALAGERAMVCPEAAALE